MSIYGWLWRIFPSEPHPEWQVLHHVHGDGKLPGRHRRRIKDRPPVVVALQPATATSDQADDQQDQADYGQDDPHHPGDRGQWRWQQAG